MKRCKECKNGKYNKRTDTTHCKLLDRTLLVDRAESCGDYEMKSEIKRYQERMKERNS